MNWQQAYNLIEANIAIGLHLDPNANFKRIVAGPAYLCANYGAAEGYRVQVGANSFINVPIQMLRILFEATINNGGTFNRGIFGAHYPQQLRNKDCHVHAIGKIFSNAGVMQMNGARNYQIVA